MSPSAKTESELIAAVAETGRTGGLPSEPRGRAQRPAGGGPLLTGIRLGGI